jgi:hypothetical protein
VYSLWGVVHVDHVPVENARIPPERRRRELDHRLGLEGFSEARPAGGDNVVRFIDY